MTKRILCILMVFCMLFMFVACNKTETPQGDKPTVGGSNAEPKYNIFFYTGNSVSVRPMIGIKAGDKITEPQKPILIGSQFMGWYTDYGTYQNAFVWDTMPAHDITLYAKWEQKVDNEQLSQYEADLNANSQNGHLYIHYMRFDNDPEQYAKMSLWVWPKAKTGRTFNWVKDSNGKVVVDDIGGAVCDIDLTQYYTGAGNDQKSTLQFFKDGAYGDDYKPEYIKDASKYMDPEIGFLIVYDESKDSGDHWLSDGGNQYFTIAKAVRENGSIHVFAVQDNVGSFVFNVADKGTITNPYENDDGTNVSKADVDSSALLSPTKDPESLLDTVSGVGYQIMVASFADSNGDGYGDIRGIIENLDYLESLNVDVLWLTPIQLSDSYHGYDIIDYCSIDPKFGTMDDYKELLTKCHEKDMKVIMDLVLNHTSINNVWFQKSAKMVVEDGVDYRSFYHWRNHTKENLTGAWYQYSEYDYSYYAKFASGMPELNYDYQATRDAILGVADFWMTLLGDSGVDGFRIDAVKHIYMEDEVKAKDGDIIIKDFDSATNTDYSTNVTKNLNFFCWLIDGIKKINPNAYVVGENFDGHAFNVAPYYKAFDGMLDFYMYYQFGEIASHMGWASGIAGEQTSSDGSVPTGKNTSSLYGGAWSYTGMMGANTKYGNQVTDSLFTSNHDIPRLLNNVERNYSGANWSAGTITSANAKEAQQRALTAIAAMMTMPGISWIYYGDEIGMSSNYGAGENKNSPHVDRWYRQPFKWTTNAADSKYTTSYSISGDKTYNVEWDNYNKTIPGARENNAFLDEVKKWTELKSTDPVIRYGTYEFRSFGGNGDMMSYTRSYNGTTYWIVCNFGNSEYRNPSNVFGGGTLVCASNGASMSYLPAGGSMVVKIAG